MASSRRPMYASPYPPIQDTQQVQYPVQGVAPPAPPASNRVGSGSSLREDPRPISPRTGSSGTHTGSSGSGSNTWNGSTGHAGGESSRSVSDRLSEWKERFRSGSGGPGTGFVSPTADAPRRSSADPARPPIPSASTAPPGTMVGGDGRLRRPSHGGPIERVPARHSFSEGTRDKVLPGERELDDQLAQIQRESIRAEEERQFALMEEERMYRLALASSSAEEARRAEQLAREQAREEEALRRAMEHSRSERERIEQEEQEALRLAMETSRKDKGKAVETEEQRREREELEMVMAMSLAETRRYDQQAKGAMTSAEMFEQLSRPRHNTNENGRVQVEGLRGRSRSRERSPADRENSFGGISHQLFSRPLVEASPEPETPSSSWLDPSRRRRSLRNDSMSSRLADVDSMPEHRAQDSSAEFDAPPPAYDFPAHAAENDAPGDIILGPNQSMSMSNGPGNPSRNRSWGNGSSDSPGAIAASTSIFANRDATEIATTDYNDHHGSRRHRNEADSPSHASVPSMSFYSEAVAAALSPYDQSQSPSHLSTPSASSSPQRSSGYFDLRRNSARESFMSTVSVAGSFESERTMEGWQPARSRSVLSTVGRFSEQLDTHHEIDPFDDRYETEGEHLEESTRPVYEYDRGGQDNDAMYNVMMRRTEDLALEDAGSSLHNVCSSPLQRSSITPQIQVEDDRDQPEIESPALPHRPPSLRPVETQQLSPVSSTPSPMSTPTTPAGLTSANHLSSQVSLPSSLRTSPSFGGFVESTASSALADENVLSGVQWGFVPSSSVSSSFSSSSSSKASLQHPPLEHEGDFPRGAQLSRQCNPDTGEMDYAAFAVEARSWQSLLVFLMWHGNSRFEAAPSDLQHDKTGRGLSIAVVLDFYRSIPARQPRVRVRIELQPPHSSASDTVTSTSMDSSSPLPNSFDYENPSITIKPTVASGSPTPLILPIPLSALATFLSHAHAKSRQVPKPGWREATLVPSLQPSTPAQELAIAIDMFKSLNGERIVEDAEQVEGDERGLIDRLKHRLKRRRAKGPKEIRMTAGSEPVGRNGNLPEGANLITPFMLTGEPTD